MELKTPKKYRTDYIEGLAQDKKYNGILKELLNKVNTKPVSNFKYMNPEEAPDFDNENRELQELLLDMYSLNEGTIEIKDYVDSIFKNVDNTVETINTILKQEEERLEDINMLCGADSEYNMSVPIYAADFGDEENYEALDEKTIGCKAYSSNSVNYSIISINGNGYSGNAFVYNNGEFENESDDRNKPEYIYDDNDVTAYEYSRLCTSERANVIDSIINYDNKDVEITMTLSSEEAVCKMKLLSDNTDLKIKSLETSIDGITFVSRLKEPLLINSKTMVYSDSTYIYGSNYICFPYSYYVRITLSSSNFTDDTIAVASDDDTVTVYENTKRKKIRINNIQLFSSSYLLTDITSEEILEAGSVDKVGLFAAEYIPDHFTGEKYITYYLIINGEEHEIVPLNSGLDGIKIIKFKEETDTNTENYMKLIAETIKSLQLRITIEPEGKGETPYVSSLKLMLAKDTGSIYVS